MVRKPGSEFILAESVTPGPAICSVRAILGPVSCAITVIGMVVGPTCTALRVTLTHVRTFGFKPRWLSRVATSLFAGRIRSETEHPISRVLIRLYDPVLTWVLQRKWLVLGAAALLVVGVLALRRGHSESVAGLRLKAVASQTVAKSAKLSLNIQVEDPADWGGKLRYRLKAAPPQASIVPSGWNATGPAP